MNVNQSEKLFEKYLNKTGIQFSKNFTVNTHNVDFRLIKGDQDILCDVKEVRDTGGTLGTGIEKVGGRLDAQKHIRGDIKKLRDKFNCPATSPLILVSMNFSSIFFTALTVSRAMMGEIGEIFERSSGNCLREVHHLHTGNASLTQKKNRSISGVFLFDVANGEHYLFRSPYANHVVQADFFSDVKIIDLRKDETSEEFLKLGCIEF